jgi:hypothetical protein
VVLEIITPVPTLIIVHLSSMSTIQQKIDILTSSATPAALSNLTPTASVVFETSTPAQVLLYQIQ